MPFAAWWCRVAWHAGRKPRGERRAVELWRSAVMASPLLPVAAIVLAVVGAAAPPFLLIPLPVAVLGTVAVAGTALAARLAGQ